MPLDLPKSAKVQLRGFERHASIGSTTSRAAPFDLFAIVKQIVDAEAKPGGRVRWTVFGGARGGRNTCRA